MLTLDKLKMYRRFDGDIDGYSRSRVDDQSGITDEEWHAIDELRQALFLVQSGQARQSLLRQSSSDCHRSHQTRRRDRYCES